MNYLIIDLLGAPGTYFRFYTTVGGLETDTAEESAFTWADEEERDAYLKLLDTAYPARFGPGGTSNPPSGGGRPDEP